MGVLVQWRRQAKGNPGFDFVPTIGTLRRRLYVLVGVKSSVFLVDVDAGMAVLSPPFSRLPTRCARLGSHTSTPIVCVTRVWEEWVGKKSDSALGRLNEAILTCSVAPSLLDPACACIRAG